MPRREKSPGVKILWIWTFGTAAILIANVMRTRIRDFQSVMDAEEQKQQQQQQQQNDNESVKRLSWHWLRFKARSIVYDINQWCLNPRACLGIVDR
ncbi:basic leucine zipper/W2 domain protein [Trifolium repens]|nr:basic leucine zipper/W2 domain protein [Trifolium repens]